MKKLIIFALVAVFVAVGTPVLAAQESEINDCSRVPFSYAPGSGCNFTFWDGNGNISDFNYKPDSYHDRIMPDGTEIETSKGIVPNNTGHEVVYNANSGNPIRPNETCFSFVTERATTNWELTISPTGNFTMTCYFPAN